MRPISHRKNIKTVALILCGFFTTMVQAQEANTAAGGNASGSGGTAAYSVGQIVYSTQTGANGTVAEGVQQTYDFCNYLTKPTFNTNKYTFCGDDSVKLSVTNINKGDTLKWYYGTKSDLTNLSNKTFTDSTKLFVTRTDSVGCVISSDTIQLTKYTLPVKPTLAWNGTQLTATTSSIGVNYQWLLSNSSISGATSASFKPAAIGSYTIQITDANACKNLSDSFMLVVTALAPSIETSIDHIVKIFPNPASTNVMLYFKQKPKTTLTIQLLSLKGQLLKQIKTNSQATQISLREIITGNYIIQIIGKDYNQTQQLLIIQ
jgi:hypothetical protein